MWEQRSHTPASMGSKPIPGDIRNRYTLPTQPVVMGSLKSVGMLSTSQKGKARKKYLKTWLRFF